MTIAFDTIRYVKSPYTNELIRTLPSSTSEDEKRNQSTLKNLSSIGWELLTEEEAEAKYPELVKTFIKIA